MHVESCDANGFFAFGSGVGGVAGLRFVPSAAATLEVKDSTFKGNSLGIYIQGPSGTAKAAIDGVRLEGGGGLLADAGSNVTVRDSLASGTQIGFDGENNPGKGNAPTELNLENCAAFNIGLGGVHAASTSTGSTTVRVSNCTVLLGGFESPQQGPAALLTRGNNTVDPLRDTSSGTYPAK